MINILTKEHKEKIKYLKQIKALDKDIDRKILELEKWHARACKITPVISDMPHGTNVSDNVADCVVNISDIDAEINKSIDKYVELKEEIENKINAIDDDRYRAILKDRYFLYQTWEEIAYKNHYVFQWVYKLHEQALDLISIED